METSNSELLKEVQNATKIQTMQGLGRTISNQIVPVIEVNPKIVKTGLTAVMTSLNTATTTLLTTPTNQDVYICSASLSVQKDAESTSTGVYLTCQTNGVNQQFLWIAGLASTAMSGQTNMTFPHPIKVDRNTSIHLKSSASAAVTAAASINYFVDEQSNAA